MWIFVIYELQRVFLQDITVWTFIIPLSIGFLATESLMLLDNWDNLEYEVWLCFVGKAVPSLQYFKASVKQLLQDRKRQSFWINFICVSFD